MSRNTNYRRMALKLPQTPLLNNGKAQYDGAGNIIYANHFRAMKKIVADNDKLGYSSKSPQTFAALNLYMQAVMEYDKKQKKQAKRDVNRFLIVCGIIFGIYLVFELIKK